MAKYKTTKKDILDMGARFGEPVISVGYCNLQYLLYYEHPFAYSTRAEGWACDYYNVGNAIISIGYSPCGKSVPIEIQRRYENIARRIYENKWTWKQKKGYMWKLLQKFVQEVTK